MIDLHTHSTHSDGTLTPSELAAAASAAGLSAAALTDHDTISGVPEFIAAAPGGLRAVPGVEISAEFAPGGMHLLGYGFRLDDPDLGALLGRLRAGRAERNRAILERLADHGLPLDWEEVAALAGGEVVGRPHIAQAMTARGHVADPTEAFRRWLARGRPAYVSRYRPSPEDAVAVIAAAGGAPALAHPVTLELSGGPLVALVRRLRDAGLRGIEAHHPEQTPSARRAYAKLAADHGLVAVGGSDFHGARTPGLRLGRGFGDLRVPDDALSRLIGA